LGVGLETAKFAALGFVAATPRRREMHWLFRLSLVAYAVGIISIDAASLYSQLVAAHLGHHDVADLFRLWPGSEEVICSLIAWGGACSGPLGMVLAAGLSAARQRAA
jgi:hypothetical protein